MKRMYLLRSMGYHYRYAARFMDEGGIYGRALTYPHTGYKPRRIFSKVIRIHFSEPDLRRNTANARALNNSEFHVMFAYELRPKKRRPRPPKAREPVPIVKVEPEPETAFWRFAA